MCVCQSQHIYLKFVFIIVLYVTAYIYIQVRRVGILRSGIILFFEKKDTYRLGYPVALRIYCLYTMMIKVIHVRPLLSLPFYSARSANGHKPERNKITRFSNVCIYIYKTRLLMLFLKRPRGKSYICCNVLYYVKVFLQCISCRVF